MQQIIFRAEVNESGETSSKMLGQVGFDSSYLFYYDEFFKWKQKEIWKYISVIVFNYF